MLRRALGALVVVAVCAHALPTDAAATIARADAIFYRSTVSFMEIKRSGPRTDPDLDWSDDGCSVPWYVELAAPVLRYASAVFREQCQQHDFGYRNYGSAPFPRLDPSEARRRSIDDHFYAQMRIRCGEWWIRYLGGQALCSMMAHAYYLAVRLFGRL